MTEVAFTVNNLWILIATVLVFVMHLGFSMLEAGFVRKKNTVNILFKNAMIIAIGLLSYFFIGFNLMYPDEALFGGLFGFDHARSGGLQCRARDLFAQDRVEFIPAGPKEQQGRGRARGRGGPDQNRL